MSNDWDDDNPFAPDEEDRHSDFFNRAAKYVVSSDQQPPPAPAESAPRIDPLDWERPRSALPEAPAQTASRPDSPPPPPASAAEPGAESAAPDEADALYVDEHGVPMLFDVVISGDDCRAAGLFLPRHARPEQAPVAETATAPPPAEQAAPPATPAGPSMEEIEARLQQAIDNALPQVTEIATSLLRDSLSDEIHRALRPEPRD